MPDPISIRIDAGMVVTVTVPNVNRQNIVDIISTFLAAGPDGGAQNQAVIETHMKEAFSKARALRLVIASDSPEKTK